jgi:hypothetical protein
LLLSNQTTSLDLSMLSRSLNVVVAIVLALLPLPAVRLLDYFNRGCGDGLCGFFPAILILGGLAIATVVFLVRSARRGEHPAALRLVPLALWVLAFVPMVL